MSPEAQAARLYELGRYPEALHAARKALRRHPANARLWNVSAVTALALGLPEDALQFWAVAIAKDPRYADAHYNLGVLQFERGNLEAAAKCLARAVLLSPGNARALNNLGAVLGELHRFAEAVALLERSIALDATDPNASHNLGVCLMELGRFAEAQASLDRAIAQKPDFAEALASRAALCLNRGDEAGANRFLAAALGADPCNATAHHTRAGQTTTAHDRAWLEQLATAYGRRGSLSPKEAVRLSFAMGKVREDLGDYDAAFDAYAEGNRLHHSLHPFDEERDEIFVKNVTTALGADLYVQCEQREHSPQRSSDSRVPIFVVGMPRSGTSLVEQILSTHPRIHGAGELRTLGDLAPVAALPSAGSPAPWIAKLRTVGEEYLARVSTGVQADFLVDKMPHNYRFLGLLPWMLPGAKVIHVTRDPLDTCFSCFATAFFESHEYSYDQGTLGRHYVRYRRLMDHWRRVLPPGSILEVSYEALVRDMQGETVRMLEYVGVAWNEACVRFYENRRVVRTASRVQVTQPIYTRSIGRARRFEKHLSPLRAALAPVLEASVT